MDYTTPGRVKAALQITETTQDTLIGNLVTAASRAIDKHCTGTIGSEADNYFELAAITDEQLANGVFDRYGRLHVQPHKPVIAAVSSLSYRLSPREGWRVVSGDSIVFAGMMVQAWVDGSPNTRPVFVKISYTGGLSATAETLPADLIEAATVLAGRYYREDEGGLSDAIGVAELGVITYTKAMPTRVIQMLQPYLRNIPW